MSMLDEALKVVEAARRLRLSDADGRTVSALDPAALHAAMADLREAIEGFDAATSESESPGLRIHRRMTPAVSPSRTSGGGPDGPEATVADLRALLGLEARAPVTRPDSVAAGPASPQVAQDPSHDFVGDGAFFDGGESAADLIRAADAIDAKLAYAVSKVGWSPRLRALAAAQRIALEHTFIEVEDGKNWVRIPGYVWGTLTVSIAQAALDQDLTLALPRNRHDRDHGHEHVPAPRPDQ